MASPPTNSSDPEAPGGCADGEAPIVEGAVWTSSDAVAPDSAELGKGKICALPPEGAIDWAERTARVKVATITVDGELAHMHSEASYASPKPDDGAKLVFDVVAVPPVAPMVATVGAMTFHGSPLAPGTGSADVYAEGMAIFRVLRDPVLCPVATPLPHGGGVVMPMGPPPTVFVNGFPVARAGDAVMELLGGPNPIMLGAMTVFAGPPAPPSMSVDPHGHPPGDDRSAIERGLDWIDHAVEIKEAKVSADLHLGEGQVAASGGGAVDVDDAVAGAEGTVEGSGTLVRFDGELVVEITVFGEDYRLLEQRFGTGFGHWRGRADLIFDPIQKRSSGSADGDISLFEPEEDAP